MLGSLMAGQGRTEDAQRYFRAAVEGRKGTPDRVLRLSKQCRAAGEPSAAREVLRIGLERSPGNGDLALALCKLLAGGSNRSLEGALRIAESTCRSNNRQHADLLAMLAWLYSKSGRPHDALIAAEQSLARANEQGLSEIARAMEEMVLEYRQSATRAP